ncbi:hypothetical protein COCC4DRAFT_195909 [Bipolaris maydis ATCC 48331]|uniref:Uncharacterized protein n=2 Tax=Cochliobolus heterostrophus TaxID=5016 RepID=M2UN20_COCH5|nr:uncharacterized protein COCC4DRAFT_195909 [Bipolaris maydis ATCC 48331]EMD89307.1 hypothetical protein COCHEDRAFT_1205455 [Bipolaris maydis C5]ENI04976.1 hypothetical protein COCC4DRAFT_195909 [Bipolaris maydis ATCC 48331]
MAYAGDLVNHGGERTREAFPKTVCGNHGSRRASQSERCPTSADAMMKLYRENTATLGGGISECKVGMSLAITVCVAMLGQFMPSVGMLDVAHESNTAFLKPSEHV